MSNPALPIITLARGAWRAEVYDPRADPLTLGARYVHGGYVRALWLKDRCLTGRVGAPWDRFDGEGLPETFENSLGWGATPMNEEYLRIGAGRLRRSANSPREAVAHQPLVGTLDWEITEQAEDAVTMRASDDVLLENGKPYGYTLCRRVALREDGLDSTTTLTLRIESWLTHPVTWFAHPFFAHDGIDATAITFPGDGAQPGNQVGPTLTGPMARSEDGRWRMSGVPQGRAVATGLWGERGALVVHLDTKAGGGRMALQLDRPLDHAVMFATARVFSVEPKLARAWVHGETASWTLSYRWLG